MRKLLGFKSGSARFIFGIDINPYHLLIGVILFRCAAHAFIRVGQDVEFAVRAHYAAKIAESDRKRAEQEELKYLRWVVTGEPQRIAQGFGPLPLQ